MGNALGLSPSEAELLFGRARARLGNRALRVRILAFAVATAPILRLILPPRLRRVAVRPLVYALLPGPPENLLYAGVAVAPQEATAR